MSDLKQLALKLVGVCERLYAERTLLESMMRGAKVPGWKPMYESLVNDPKMRAEIRRQFQPLYDLIEREADADKAIQELMRVLPKPDKLN